MIERIQRISGNEPLARNDDVNFFQPQSAKLRGQAGAGGPIKIKLSKKRPTEDSQIRQSLR